MEKKSNLLFKISGLYSNTSEIVELVEKHNLNELLSNIIKNFDDCFLNREIDTLPVLASVSLTKINDVVLKISPEEEKKKIQYLISDLFDEYQSRINNLEIAPHIYSKIVEALKIACNVAGYNYEELEKILRLEKNVLQAKYKSKVNNQQCYYEWKRKPHELDELAKDMKDINIICSVKEFKKLFKASEELNLIHMNIEKKIDLLIIFSILYEKKIIRVVGTTGKFVPLVKSLVDNQNFFIFKKEINKTHELIKRKSSEYNALREKYSTLIFKNIDPK